MFKEGVYELIRMEIVRREEYYWNYWIFSVPAVCSMAYHIVI